MRCNGTPFHAGALSVGVKQPPECEDSVPFSQIESHQNDNLAVNCSCRGELYEEQPMPPGVTQTVPSEPLGLGRPWLLKTLNASTLTRRNTLSVIGKLLNSEMSALQFIGPCNTVWPKGLVTSI